MNKIILFLGQKGSISHVAATHFQKKGELLHGKNSLDEIFDLVSRNSSNLGIVPVENSLTGSINLTFDLLLKKKVSIVSELVLTINHCLIAKTERKISTFKYCLSHPEIFKQCSNFLKKHRNLKLILESDSGTAVKKLLALNKNYCAIGNKNAAVIFKLNILDEHLEDNQPNLTRFLEVSSIPNLNGNKASIIFSLAHISGSLVKALKPISDSNLNLTKIESRPILGSPWEYLFLVDLEINTNSEGFKNCVSEMKKNTKFLKVLGIYNKGEIINAE